MATPTIPKSAESRSEVSDLDMIVAQVRKAHEATAGPDPHRPWLEPLPSSLRLHDLQSAPDATGSRKRTVGNPVGVIGLADLPKAQAQPPYRLDVAELGNVAIYGTNRTGKSTLLRSLTYDLASRYSPDEVNIYGIDHASRGLGALTALPHVGAVLRDDQREETDRFINMLRTWVDKRKAQLGAGTASSFRQLRETAENAPPFIFVMIDGYANFHATYENVDYGRFNEQFARLVADGPSVGVHFILTATNHRGIPSTVATHCAGRLVFRQANPDDYYHHGLEKLIGGKPGPGRCWDHDGVELQVATITDLPDGRADAEAIQLLAGRTKRLDTVSAATVKTRPDRVTADMLETHPSRPQRMVPLGLDTGTLHTVYLDLDQKNTLMVAGPARSGTTSMIVHAATQILTSASRKSLLTSASIAQQMTETFADRINVVDWYGDVDSENLVEALDSDTIVALDASPLIQQQHFDGEAATGLTPEALGSIRASAGAVLIEVDTDVLTGPSGYAPWLDGCLFRDSAVVALTSQALVVDRLRFEPAVSDTSLRPGQGIYSSEQSPAIVQFAVTGNANQRGT
jgi:S-DNA-T family DNA segregation ATPase FtsK/SpoIIIE